MRPFEFIKSSYSARASDCVEVARNVPRTVAVRDSKNTTGPVLLLAPAAWAAFQVGLRRQS
ncbi:DUF397 domain-containing protein [Streptomyces sp. AM 4-1-1]|uniref:DUF397 domain-containing protein n=1 Tax=Streptomyces sp. AM 4-1-1 TaxID=3028710 RepID=UPI0023B92DB0|nr:DUF397 domain-containing protein [Streptomyces sp. AM 4-1-1]WEH34648.1 DUF397 domain-containing protein [Streptomyces sp. AM 4-1-1]